jgi:hypothetical protein
MHRLEIKKYLSPEGTNCILSDARTGEVLRVISSLMLVASSTYYLQYVIARLQSIKEPDAGECNLWC